MTNVSHLLKHGWICLFKCFHEVSFHLFFVLLGHLSHCLQIGENLPLLVDILDVALTFSFDLIYAPIELIDKRSDLLLVGLLLRQFPLNDILALGQLVDISLHLVDFFAHLRIGLRKFKRFLGPELGCPIQLISLLFCLLVSVCDLAGLLFDHVGLASEPLHQSLDRLLFTNFFIDEVLLCV